MLREQPLPIYINILCYDTTLLDRSTKLKEFIQNYICNNNDREIFDLQRRHTRHTFSPNKNFFLNKMVNIFYIYIFHNLNNHNNISYISVL